MSSLNRADQALITVYNDTPEKTITKALTLYLPDRDIKILEPDSIETLDIAAQNSVLIVVGVTNDEDDSLYTARVLQDNPLIIGDIVACCLSNITIPTINIMAKGFDTCIHEEDLQKLEFKKYLVSVINKGANRLESLIQEQEYKRLNDALSIAPVSIIIFDADKKAVFVSDHYFRAYPKIAPRLIRGLRVYDAFEMMAQEEGIDEKNPLHKKLQSFWHNLNGSLEFSLEDGTSYRLKAVQLPSNRGTVVTAQNISEYMQAQQSFTE